MTLEALKQAEYKMRYADQCRYIQENLIPASGQARSLQGELLRECEKLRYEAQVNGNWNWDELFAYFCDHISQVLCAQDFFTSKEKTAFAEILVFFKSCGEYARSVLDNDELPDDHPVDLDRIAYVEDNLYDVIVDAIGRLHFEYGHELPYTPDPNIYR